MQSEKETHVLKKIFLLSIFIIVAFSSIVTGVFAWFAASDGNARLEDFAPNVKPNVELEIDMEEDTIYTGDHIKDLVYITDADFHTVGFDFYGYAAFYEIRLSNSTNTASLARVSIQIQYASEYGLLSGSQAGIKYLVVEEKNQTQGAMFQLQSMSNLFDAMTVYNAQGITVPANSSKSIYVAVWGYYDGLTQYQKDNFHSIIYRVRLTLS